MGPSRGHLGSQGSNFRFPRRSLLACKLLGGPREVTQNAWRKHFLVSPTLDFHVYCNISASRGPNLTIFFLTASTTKLQNAHANLILL